ncbi:MAG TPA: hypothetical protein VIX17_11650 [Pyrinomonadaceae bacterium]|jgi:hypothetical protein
MTFRVPVPYRVTTGPLRSDASYGNNGAFVFRSVIPGRQVVAIASDGEDWENAGLKGEPWEHVSVHCYQGKKQFTPTWIEMCAVKDMFWDKEDVVIQFHPRESDYVNNHANTLHLWRPTQTVLPTPPSETVGIKELGTFAGESECVEAKRA